MSGVKQASTQHLGRRAARRRTHFDRLLITALLLVAAVMALWPVAATYNNDHKAYVFAQGAVTKTSALDGSTINQRLAAARSYNEALSPTAMMTHVDAFDSGDSSYAQYGDLLPGESMAILRIPAIGSTLPILHGTSEKALSKGAGHMFGTHLPIGADEIGNGQTRHVGLAAHRGLPETTAFDNLPDMVIGDHFFIDVLGETLAYHVVEINTVLPNQMEAMAWREGRDLVTLVTCTPYAVNTHRLLVTGERIPLTNDLVAAEAVTGFDWSVRDTMWPRIIAAVVAFSILLVLSGDWVYSDVRAARAARQGRPKTSTAAGVRTTASASLAAGT